MYMSKLHTFLLLPRTVAVSAADLLSRLHPARRTRSAVQRNVCSEVVELGLIATEVMYTWYTSTCILLIYCNLSWFVTLEGWFVTDRLHVVHIYMHPSYIL